MCELMVLRNLGDLRLAYIRQWEVTWREARSNSSCGVRKPSQLSFGNARRTDASCFTCSAAPHLHKAAASANVLESNGG